MREKRDIKPRTLPQSSPPRPKAVVPASASDPVPAAKPVGRAKLRQQLFPPRKPEDNDEFEPTPTAAKDNQTGGKGVETRPPKPRPLCSPVVVANAIEDAHPRREPVIKDVSGVTTPTVSGETRPPELGQVIVDEQFIPEWLRVGQPLDLRITVASSEGKSPKLSQRTTATLTHLRTAFAHKVVGAMKRASETLNDVIREDRGINGQRSLDVVILAMAYLKQSSPIPGDLKNEAFETFRANRATYEAMLGDVLGKDFLEAFDRYCSDEGLHSAADEVRIRRRGLTQSKPLTTTSGFPELDLLTGGLSDYVLVSGNPATDPAGLALNLIYRAVEADPTAAALVVSLRRTVPEVVDRLMGIAHAVPFSALANLDNMQTASAFDEGERSNVLRRVGILVHRGAEKTFDLDQWGKLIKDRVQKLIDQTYADRLLILIDSLQEVTFAPEERSQSLNKSELHHFTESELDRRRVLLLQNLLRTGRNFNPAIIAVNKSTKVPSGRKMALDDVYGGVDLIYPATTILLLDRDDRAATSDSVPHVLTVAKAENGFTGEVSLVYKPATRSFMQKGSGSRAAGGNPFTAEARTSSKRGGKP